MKQLKVFYVLASLAILLTAFVLPKKDKPSLKGSWQTANGTMICSETYFSIAFYDSEKRKFDATIGGTYQISGSEITFTVEYAHPDKSLVGGSETIPFKLEGKTFHYEGSQGSWVFTKIGESQNSSLAALWQIVGRENKEGKMTDIPKAARKTIKLLTDTHFQWAAINTETGEFFGTGGGTYTLADGKYTETIAFFSRDSSRVGLSLSFDAAIQEGKWTHSGKSSTGNRVHEIWAKQD
jgi:hypothetical protein